jgi:hypothetical protein
MYPVNRVYVPYPSECCKFWSQIFKDYNVHKLLKKQIVYLFAKFELVIGQFQPAFVLLFIRTCLCFLNSSHSRSKWSVVCGLIVQRQVGSSMALNLRKYNLIILLVQFLEWCGRTRLGFPVRLRLVLSLLVHGEICTTWFRMLLWFLR